MKGRTIRSIVELGIDLSGRTQRILEVAAWRKESLPLRYTGIDLFEARPANQSPLPLKRAFHDLRATGAKVQLVPGDPLSALLRTANSLAGTDLLIVAADQDRDSLERSWMYIPRMLHAESIIFVQEPGQAGKDVWRQIRFEDVQKLAVHASKSLRRAA